LGIIPLAAGVVTALRTSAKNSVRKLIDYTTYSTAEVICSSVHSDFDPVMWDDTQ